MHCLFVKAPFAGWIVDDDPLDGENPEEND